MDEMIKLAWLPKFQLTPSIVIICELSRNGSAKIKDN